MKPSRGAYILLSMVLGEVGVAVADCGIQPVDAVLFIDGAPTYLRLTNSTSLETVYNCVLENSQNVNSVILSSQIKGVQMDVGQVEESVNEVIRLLSAEAASNGRTLWKSPEELKLFKTRLARYLTSKYYGSRAILEPDMFFNLKSQRSADWLHNNREHQYRRNYHQVHPVWGKQTERRHFPTSARMYDIGRYKNTPESLQQGTNPSSVPVSIGRENTSTTESPTFSEKPSVTTPDQSDSPSASLETGSHQLKTIQAENSSYSMSGHAKTDPEVTTAFFEYEEGTTISAEGFLNVEKSKMTIVEKDVDENDESVGEEVQSRNVSRRRFKTGRLDISRNVTDNSDRTVTHDGHSSHVRPTEESSTESDKPKKSKWRRRSSKRRVAKGRQHSSTMIDPKGEDWNYPGGIRIIPWGDNPLHSG